MLERDALFVTFFTIKELMQHPVVGPQLLQVLGHLAFARYAAQEDLPEDETFTLHVDVGRHSDHPDAFMVRLFAPEAEAPAPTEER